MGGSENVPAPVAEPSTYSSRGSSPCAVFGVLGALLALLAIVVAGALTEELWFRRLEKGGS
jgi:hypothetical protein